MTREAEITLESGGDKVESGRNNASGRDDTREQQR